MSYGVLCCSFLSYRPPVFPSTSSLCHLFLFHFVFVFDRLVNAAVLFLARSPRNNTFRHLLALPHSPLSTKPSNNFALALNLDQPTKRWIASALVCPRSDAQPSIQNSSAGQLLSQNPEWSATHIAPHLLSSCHVSTVCKQLLFPPWRFLHPPFSALSSSPFSIYFSSSLLLETHIASPSTPYIPLSL